MADDPSGVPPAGALIVCEFCERRKSPIDGRMLRACPWCAARTDPNVTCECTYCEWLEEL